MHEIFTNQLKAFLLTKCYNNVQDVYRRADIHEVFIKSRSVLVKCYTQVQTLNMGAMVSGKVAVEVT